MTSSDANIALHVCAGAPALLLALIIVARPKGDARHRVTGRLFLALGCVVMLTALVGVLRPAVPGPLMAATLAASYQLVAGARTLAIRDRGPGGIDVLLAVAALAGILLLHRYLVDHSPSWSPALGIASLGYVGLLAVVDLSRSFWRRVWLRFWRLDHGLKLIGAATAMASAAAGNLLRDLQPWSQIVPSALGFGVLLGIAWRHWPENRREQGAAT